uniref:BHLH domain-containing protein n=1 Tax=Lotharella oceanica TaxID=641309 RepID=A0A7S2TZ38_9EUKA|mmetsp:Transcript_36514/g.67459  ORF Transcript_36514/g.67459 Transcript_36514/m.67459 type:complete len:332 (-) Transcript_36514:65-1060(-)
MSQTPSIPNFFKEDIPLSWGEPQKSASIQGSPTQRTFRTAGLQGDGKSTTPRATPGRGVPHPVQKMQSQLRNPIGSAHQMGGTGFGPQGAQERGCAGVPEVKMGISEMRQASPATGIRETTSELQALGASGKCSPETLKARQRKQRKNDREKKRRLEIAEKFERLAGLLGIQDRAMRGDKYTLLDQALTLINSLRERNSELKNEKSELRRELVNLTKCLQNAFPSEAAQQQPHFSTTPHTSPGPDARRRSASSPFIPPVSLPSPRNTGAALTPQSQRRVVKTEPGLEDPAQRQDMTTEDANFMRFLMASTVEPEPGNSLDFMGTPSGADWI